ncbi:unnamed protein product [Prorocentrum cordatum]|uniref:Uncharacterized protein n=1 Tax=Prorocentrum cordatum TaxID=2364126 RepID=A0ABN9T7W4_9DINO|nr:unnamed protein product [Polarella glacialis]
MARTTDESAEELFVDKEGIPHWDGENIALLREYRMRAMVEYSTQSSTTEAGKEKRANLGLRLTRGLTGRSWKAAEPLLDDMESLTQDGSHQRIIEALDGLDKVAVVRKQQKFDDFFKRSRRKRGQEIVEHLRTLHNKYKQRTELDTGTKLSDDLYAHFLLEGAMLTDDQKRLVTMVADNKHETKAFENTLKTNYHDLHLQEKNPRPPPPHPAGRPKGGGKGGKDKSKRQPRAHYTAADDVGDEEEEQHEDYDDEAYEAYEDGDAEEDFASDAGASRDEAINNAHAAYDTARAKERKAEIAKDKQRTYCGARGKLGHWAGDPEGPLGPKKPTAKSKSRPDPRGRAAALSRLAWSSSSAPGSGSHAPSSSSAKKRTDATLFVLDDVEYDSAFFANSDRGSDLGSFKLVGSDAGDSTSGVSGSASTIPPTVKSDDEVLPCPKCSKALVARQNHRSGGWFFGCSQFPDCKGTLDYNEGEQRLREARCLHPRGLKIKMTDRWRSFSSAFGRRQEGRVVEIPVALGGRHGVIFSTEMEDCDTPLPVSLASQEALGAVLHLKEMRMELQTLAVDVQLLKALKETAFEESDGEEVQIEEVGHAFLSQESIDAYEGSCFDRARFEAERFVTADFQTTAAFEPFGGEHILTRYGAREHGWMQSQPLGADTGKPTKKPTGWLTNSAAVANHLSKRCACPPGAHQQLLGKNSGGYRAQQAATYPSGLAKAFCRGVFQQMQIDYRSSLVMDAAFPVEDASPRERSRARSPPRGEPEPEEDHQEGPPLGEDAPPAEAAAEAPEAPAEVPAGPRRGRAPARRERGARPGERPLGFRRGRRTQQGEFELLTAELRAELDTFRSWHRRLLEKMGDDVEMIIWGSDLFLGELGGVVSEPLKMVKARRGGQRLQTVQPQLHAADAPLRMVTVLNGDQLYRQGFEDWSQQPLQARRRWLPRHLLENDVVVFYFAGHERDDLPEGPAAAQQRDASRERALRLGKATALALKAARLFVCESCRRVQRPSIPRPSQLPRVDEFNVLLAMACFESVDSAGNNRDTHKNPKASEVRKFYELCWVSWAGQLEEATMVDRARSFLGEFADYLEQEGVRLDSAALASPWHIGKMERHDGIWNSMLTRVVHDEQVAGLEEMRTAVTERNRAKNTLARRAGFSPYLWVLGRDIRLPASLADDAEVERVGEQVAAATPGSRFARKVEIRTQCRMAFIQTDTGDRLRRAELRQIRPTRGPFVVGQWVLFYDQAQPVKHRPEHPDNWRGLARVIGHEGRHGAWLAFWGLTALASPEHLAAATGHEIHAWRSIAQEQELVHDAPVGGGSGVVDLRGRPKPPATAEQEPAEQGDESGMDVGPQAEAPEEQQPAPAPPEPEAPPAPPEPEAPRAAPAAPEPPAAPAPAVGAEDVPVPPDLDFDAAEFDAAIHEIMRDDGVHSEPEPGAPMDSAAFVLDNDLDEFSEAGLETYQQNEAFFTQEGIGREEFPFGLKEIKLGSLPEEQRRKFLDRGGSRDEEWRSWQDFDAAEPAPPDESEKLRSNKANIIIPMRWVDTDKNDRKYDEAGAPLPLLAKSRLVVVGFRDRLLGMFRRDAPAASRLAEALFLTLAAAMGMILSLGDSRLEPALFYRRVDGQLKGIAVSHVDDALVARMKDMQLTDLLPKVLGTFQWMWSELPFTFHGRELSSDPRGIVVKMVNYATSLKPIKIPAARRKQLQDDLNEEEAKQLLRVSGEIGWLGRQCRLDLALLSGELQRARAAPCVADLVKANLAVSEAKKGAEVALVYPANLRLATAVVGAAVDAGHANGPEHDDIERYRSCGGHVVLLTTGSTLAGHPAPVAVLDWKSGMTQRVRRSTVAAEASHLADAAEAIDWAAVLFREATNVSVDLINWQGEVQRLPRFWATGAKSSKDKRMAIEGALLREVLRCEGTHLRWIDGSQNIADVLTKLGVDKVYLYKVLREARWSLVQDPAAAAPKMKKSTQRASRKTAIDSRKTEKRQLDKLVRAGEMRDIAD